MTSILDFLLSYLLIYKYVTLFIVVFSSAIILPLPIDILTTAVGAFSSHGYFNFWLSLAVAVGANVSGDIIDYFIFKKYGHAVLREKYVKKYSYFLKLEEYVKHHAGLTIFISRFVGVLGPLVNFLAGYIKVPTSRFIFFDLLGNFFEFLLLLSLGYVIGDAWGNISSLLSIFEWLLLVGILIYFAFYLFKKK